VFRLIEQQLGAGFKGAAGFLYVGDLRVWGYRCRQWGLDLQRAECFGPNPEEQLDVWHDWDRCVCAWVLCWLTARLPSTLLD